MGRKHMKNKCKGEKRYEIKEVFDALGEQYLLGNKKDERVKDDIEFDGFVVHRDSLRYKLFYQKGVVCAKCGRVGTHFTLDKMDPRYEGNRRHFNLYAEDGTLMTKDHIIPKCKGGKNSVDNLQPMCVSCNVKKGGD